MIRRAARKFISHRYGLGFVAFMTAALCSGVVCVAFMRSFDAVFERRLSFDRIGPWMWITTPALFLLSVRMLRRVAPEAEGTGIPQAIYAAEHLNPATEDRLFPLVSPRTFVVKIVSLLLGIWACASTGREGPSVHVAACTFIAVMMLFRRFTGISFDLRSAVVAGSASGLAAAFNTPLAGVTFAIEELSSDYFDAVKEIVLLAIICSAIAAKTLTGEYAYFGRLPDPADIPTYSVLLIGVAGGLLGAVFSGAILGAGGRLKKASKAPRGWLVSIALSLLLVATGFFGGESVFGPGNNVASTLLSHNWTPSLMAFPVTKLLATLFTYWSGLAGGIFAPCLGIGASLGADVGHWLGISTATCAIVGMAGFLSGTIQAPVTTFVIIFEMTGNHRMLLPIMLAALIAFIISKLVGAKPLYKALSNNYAYLLGEA